MRFFILLYLLLGCVKAFSQSYDDLPFTLKHAVAVIESTYGDEVKVKPKSLIKFGKNEDLDQDVAETIMTLAGTEANETYVSTNLIDKISSSSGSDTNNVVIEGHKCLANGDKIFVVQTKTLEGQTEAALTTPLCRATRLYNDSATDFVGTIYVYQDDTVTSGVPQTNSKVHLIVPIGSNQSLKASTSLSNRDYWIITNGNFSVLRSASSSVDFELQIRESGKVFRTIFSAGTVSTGSSTIELDFNPAIIVPKNADVRVIGTSSANNTAATASLKGFLALVQE